MKSPNNAGQPAAEGMEGSGLAKGNLRQQNAPRTPSRDGAPSALERVRQAATGDKTLRFTALLHHVYDWNRLRAAYLSLKKEAAPGVDGETWRHYGEAVEDNLCDLSDRLKRGAYRAKPVRRVYILKEDGRQRPLGVYCAGRQNRSARDRRGAQRHLRGRLPRLLVTGSGRGAASITRWTRSTRDC